MKNRYELYSSYEEYEMGYCVDTTDDEEEAFDWVRDDAECVAWDTITQTFLE